MKSRLLMIYYFLLTLVVGCSHPEPIRDEIRHNPSAPIFPKGCYEYVNAARHTRRTVCKKDAFEPCQWAYGVPLSGACQ